ncbi:MAG: amidase domain-containing protein [Clostridia bacterium]|nr:amidase domain-containing protein [Clostridia bacterium]
MPIYYRQLAINYARRWAFDRNPAYYDFSSIGGDCTNYVSQCLFAGSGIMNTDANLGWYYYSVNDRAPAWTGVSFLSDFLLRKQQSTGVYGKIVSLNEVEPGDVIQLEDDEGELYHTVFVCARSNADVFVASHSADRWYYPLQAYHAAKIKPIHILGVNG